MKRALLIAAGLALFGFYLWRAAPTITIGDAAELSAVGKTLGIGHSPGYPLYSVVMHLMGAMLPGNAAYQSNSLSAVWTLATVAVVAGTLLRLTGSVVVALLAGFFLGVGPLWINQALVTEVFGFNSFFAAVLLSLALAPATPARAYLCAYLLGIGLGNHHTLILLLPALLVAFWPALKDRPSKRLPVAAGFALLGLSLYAFLMIRAHQAPLMNWEEPATWERFWKLITRARYGSFQLAQGAPSAIAWQTLVPQFRYIAETVWRSFGPGCLGLLIGIGLLRSPRWRGPLAVLLTAFFFSGPFFLLWTHLPVTLRTRAILDRFMYLPLVPASLLMGLGFAWLNTSLRQRTAPWAASALLLGSALAWIAPRSHPFERDNFSLWDFGGNLLRNAPSSTLLFADRADEAEFSLAFMQRAVGRRPDVHFVDCNAGVSASIYGSNYYDIWGRQRLAIRMAEERQRIAAWPGPVYYATHDPNMIPIARTPEGLLHVVSGKSPRRSLAWEELHHFRRPQRRHGRRASWDRGLYAGYLQQLAQDAIHSGRSQHGAELYRGVSLYAQR